MSASTGLAKQADDLARLLALASLRKEDIAAAGDETRRQMQLTSDEQTKVAEARAYITKHATLATELKRREDELANKCTQLDLDKKQHLSHVASENTRLEEFSAKLDAKDRRITDDAKQLEKAKDTFSGLKIDHERQHRELIASCQKQESANTAVANANAAEAARLTEWAATLKRKAELVRQQMANF